ncbi:hypothetical protein CEP51_001962 [Fusarium floridanum]|nr:hypothetical protein CEP51_001962 [Fusarium floridanum]
MPPRLPTTMTTATEAVRAFVRPFSCTASAPRELFTGGTHTSRLANLNSSRRGADRSPRFQPGDAATRMMERYRARDASFVREKAAQMEFLRNQKISGDFLRQMPRRWEAGDVYSPHDLSPVEMQKWRKRSVRNVDVVDALGISPLDMYKNFSLIEHFTSPSGMINHSNLTRLRPVNQRKVAKMVRRVQGMGIYPSVHAHPEMLREPFFSRY